MARGGTHAHVLGGIELRHDGAVLHGHELPGTQARVVLANLLLDRRSAVPVDDVAAAVWGASPPATWRAALRSLVAQVRALVVALSPDAGVVSDGGAIRLQLPEPVLLDAETARRRLVEATVAHEEGRHGDALRAGVAAERSLTEAFLPVATCAWAARVRSDLADDHRRALLLLGRVHLARGQPDRAVRTARELLASAPLRESAHRLLMEALAASGEAGEAAQAFEDCRRLLRDRLGVGPSRVTVQLHTRLLQAAGDGPPVSRAGRTDDAGSPPTRRGPQRSS